MSRENPFSKYWKKEADILWSSVIIQTGRCAYCGTRRNLQAHHLIPRRHNFTRHKVECGLCLCKYHHLYCSKISPHLAKKAFEDWLKKNFPEKYRWVQKNKSLKNYTKVDFRAAFLKLSRCKRTILRLLDKPMVTFRRF
ncbi:MAG: hypothetical protein ACYS9V_14750 [Planctomycetota bacterium]